MDRSTALEILARHADATRGDESLIATLAQKWLQASPSALDDMLFANVLMRARISTDCGWRPTECNALLTHTVVVPEIQTNSQVIFCDGSCINNGRENARSAYGVVVRRNGATIHSHSAPVPREEPQTNQRAELRGLLYAVDYAVSSGLPTLIYTDSRYAIDCVTRWAIGWAGSEWRKSDGKPVLHTDLIKPLFEMLGAAGTAVRLHHVTAHTRAHDEISLGNAAADALASQAARAHVS